MRYLDGPVNPYKGHPEDRHTLALAGRAHAFNPRERKRWFGLNYGSPTKDIRYTTTPKGKQQRRTVISHPAMGRYSYSLLKRTVGGNAGGHYIPSNGGIDRLVKRVNSELRRRKL